MSIDFCSRVRKLARCTKKDSKRVSSTLIFSVKSEIWRFRTSSNGRVFLDLWTWLLYAEVSVEPYASQSCGWSPTWYRNMIVNERLYCSTWPFFWRSYVVVNTFVDTRSWQTDWKKVNVNWISLSEKRIRVGPYLNTQCSTNTYATSTERMHRIETTCISFVYRSAITKIQWKPRLPLGSMPSISIATDFNGFSEGNSSEGLLVR